MLHDQAQCMRVSAAVKSQRLKPTSSPLSCKVLRQPYPNPQLSATHPTAMDEQFLKKLETKAYYAVVRAFAASGKLTFDTEPIMMDLQQALGIDDDTAMELVAQVEQDQEASTLKAYDAGSAKSAATAAAQSGQAARPQASRPQAHTMDTPFGQPASKKQKKAAGAGSLPPPASARASAASQQHVTTQKPAGAIGAAAAGAAKQRPRSLPSTPQGGAAATARAVKPSRPIISLQSYHRIMQHGSQHEMEGYAAELNNREREIFTELLALGTNEEDADLNEVHRDLLRWYKLDQRQSHLSSQLAGTVA